MGIGKIQLHAHTLPYCVRRSMNGPGAMPSRAVAYCRTVCAGHPCRTGPPVLRRRTIRCNGGAGARSGASADRRAWRLEPAFQPWSARSVGVPGGAAAQRESMLPGHVRTATGERQMQVDCAAKIAQARGEPGNGMQPSGSCPCRAVAEVCGGDAVAGLFTGMGATVPWICGC